MEKQLLGSAPVLFVKDLLVSVDYYVKVLGFKQPQLWGDPPGFAMPDRDGMIVMLSRQDNHRLIHPKESIWDAYFWVSDAKSLHEEFKDKGARFRQELMVKEHYGNLEFSVEDPDGYVLSFGQESGDDKFFDYAPTDETEFLHTNPVFASQDVRRDIAWYEEQLGFKKNFDSGDEPLNYAGVSRQGVYLHMQYQFPKDMWASDLRIQVKNIQPLFDEYLKKGLLKENALRLSTLWGTNEFGLFDPSGNRIHFYEEI